MNFLQRSQKTNIRKIETLNNPNVDTGMAATVTMVQPAPPRESTSSSRPCNNPATRRPPPPPLPPGRSGGAGHKRPGEPLPRNNARPKNISTLKFPKPLRDVTAFDKKYQVGQGTYG